MNFTREPIIETIISAKEGYKLSIKSSKAAGGEEYLVSAVEVVSFGGSFFYRSGERPKVFFLPANDYEIVEVRETRLLIKQPSIEKSIKIGGGKESSTRRREDRIESTTTQEVELREDVEVPTATEETPAVAQKRERRRHRRGRRGGDETKAVPVPTHEEGEIAVSESDQSAPTQPSPLNHLLQPPEGLISDTLKKYKKSEELPTAPGIVEELASHIEHSVGDDILFAPLGPETPASDPELISESPIKDSFHDSLYSIDESELPTGLE